MKLLHKMNQLFNTCLIEKNPVIVGEMMRHNRRYGRINDRRARAGLVLGLFLKYGVLHRDPLQEFERQTSSISFPESGDCGQIPPEEMRKKTKSVETVVFDAWGVLLVMGLETYQLRAMAECELLALGSAEREIPAFPPTVHRSVPEYPPQSDTPNSTRYLSSDSGPLPFSKKAAIPASSRTQAVLRPAA